jgi:peroxiredoxin
MWGATTTRSADGPYLVNCSKALGIEETAMALTPSVMTPLDTPAADFALPDTDGKIVSLADFADAPALLVMFICNHCPFVKHVQKELTRLGREYQAKGVAVVAISSNDVATHPEDGPSKMREEKAAAGYTFPYLYDESQDVAHAYGAACTPDFFLFDKQRKLFYRGRMDASTPDNDEPNDGGDLRRALDAVLSGQAAPPRQRPSIGCNIKWKPVERPKKPKQAGAWRTFEKPGQ